MSKEGKALAGFFGLTYAISWLLWFLAFLKSERSLAVPGSPEFLRILGAFGPSAAGLLLTAFHEKKEGFFKLWRSALLVRFPLRWYLYIIFLMPLLTLISLMLTKPPAESAFSSFLLSLLISRPWLLIPLLLYFLVLQGPLAEEFGWRGFALIRLMARWNPFVSSIILGLLWSVWHLPLFFLQGTVQNTLARQGVALAFTGFLLATVMLTMLITIVYCQTGRSLWSALLFHTMSNFSHGLFPAILTPLGGLSIILALFVATMVTLAVHRRLMFTLQA